MLTGAGRAAQLLRAKPTHGRLMVTAADVEGILKNQLSAQDVQVIDTSGGCGASFDVAVVSDQFEGKKLLERHRMINTALKQQFESIHALSIKRCWTPAQQQSGGR